MFALDTHDVQTVKVSNSTFTNNVDISCSYLNGSTVPGFFVIKHTSSETVYVMVYRNGLESRTTVSFRSMNSQGPCKVVVYDLQGDEAIPEKKPALISRQGIVAATDYTISGILFDIAYELDILCMYAFRHKSTVTTCF